MIVFVAFVGREITGYLNHNELLYILFVTFSSRGFTFAPTGLR